MKNSVIPGLIILNFFLLFYIFSRINRSVTQCKTMCHSVFQTIGHLFKSVVCCP